MTVAAFPLPPEPRVTLRDDSLPHQIRIFKLNATTKIGVSCTCRATSGYGAGTSHYGPLESRVLRQPGEAIAVWRKHYAQEGTP